MPKLFVLAGRDVGRSFDLTEGAVLGRSPECEIRLHHKSVSRRHARLERDGETWYLTDLGSRNGLFVNGERVARTELVDFEEVSVGELPLRYRSDDDPVPGAPKVEVAKPDEPDEPGSVVLREAGAAPLAPIPRRRVVLDEPEAELELEEEIELEQPEPAPPPTAPRAPRARRQEEQPRGFLSTDLGQRPVWVQALVYLAVLALGCGLCYGAFLLMEHLRSTN